MAERIRESTEKRTFGAESGLEFPLTVSIGVASFGVHGRTREELLDRSDKAMYLGKAQGRNRVCTADDLRTDGGPSGAL